MSEELKPCPFCGQQDAFVEQLDSDASVVICQGMVDEHSACLARGPVGLQQSDMEDQPGRGAAVAEWNRRAQPAEAEGVEPWNGLKLAAEVAEEDGPWEPRLGMTNVETAFAQSASPTKVLELIAALSAVTAERNTLREQVNVLQSDANSWQSGYDKGRHDGTKHRQSEVEQLRAEVEGLRKDAEQALERYLSKDPFAAAEVFDNAYYGKALSGNSAGVTAGARAVLKAAMAAKEA